MAFFVVIDLCPFFPLLFLSTHLVCEMLLSGRHFSMYSSYRGEYQLGGRDDSQQQQQQERRDMQKERQREIIEANRFLERFV